MKVETVEVNGVIVNVGDEESAAKWAKKAAKVDEGEADEPKKKGKAKDE